jgi:hypothetical protein
MDLPLDRDPEFTADPGILDIVKAMSDDELREYAQILDKKDVLRLLLAIRGDEPQKVYTYYKGHYSFEQPNATRGITCLGDSRVITLTNQQKGTS